MTRTGHGCDKQVLYVKVPFVPKFLYRPLCSLGKMVFALDNFTSINVALWSYGRIESISGILYCYILGGNNVNTINGTTVALYCYILGANNLDTINSTTVALYCYILGIHNVDMCYNHA